MAEHHDVLIVGAGLSGIGAACHLRRRCPGHTFAILEARGATGGTWDLFRFPGVRSDSDMHTLAYAFAPWRDARAIADGETILGYLRATAAAHGIADAIRLRHAVTGADWDGDGQRWRVTVRVGDEPAPRTMTCGFLLVCAGYYDYEAGHAPTFPGADSFGGPVVHPQAWPEDLELSGRRVVVIGSGATAVTLVPALARMAAHVTMLQRSPSYVISMPAVDPLLDRARRRVGDRLASGLVRARNVLLTMASYQLARRAPRAAKALIRAGVARRLPAGFDVDTHFAPRYEPWDQRLCIVPNGDLFRALRDGTASIVTDEIDRFTDDGVALRSGATLRADVIVTATGLRLKPLGGLALTVDGAPVAMGDRLAYRGMMLSGVPNLAFVVGYANASWTLRADLVSERVCRLLALMRDRGLGECRPPAAPAGAAKLPLIDLSSNYVLRGAAEFPGQGERAPWRLPQNYLRERLDLRRRPIDDGVLRFRPAA